MYCEHCGLQVFPKHPVCTRCGESPTYQLFQLTSLGTLFLVVLCNGLVAILLLPRFSQAHYAGFYFRSWLWLTDKTAIYGWAPLRRRNLRLGLFRPPQVAPESQKLAHAQTSQLCFSGQHYAGPSLVDSCGAASAEFHVADPYLPGTALRLGLAGHFAGHHRAL